MFLWGVLYFGKLGKNLECHLNQKLININEEIFDGVFVFHVIHQKQKPDAFDSFYTFLSRKNYSWQS